MGALVLATLLLSIQAALFIAVALFLYRLVAWAVSGKMDAPFVPTPIRYAEIVAASLAIAPGDTVLELGSGDGRFMLSLAALEPDAKFIGIERNSFLYATALVRKRLVGNPQNAEFRRGNFFAYDLSGANKIYAYLLDTVMVGLHPKLEQEFKGRIASRAFPIPRKELSNVVALTEGIGAHGQHLLFVYDF